MHKLTTILFIALFGLVNVSQAQRPLSLYFLENIPQSSVTNPAMTPRANAFVGFPVVNMVYTGFYSDILGPELFQQNSDGTWMTLTHPEFDFNPIYKKIDKVANIRMFETIKPIMFGFSSQRGYFIFGLSEKMTQTINLPVDLFKMFDKGIPDNSSFDLGRLALNAKYYREYSFGYSYKFMEQLRVGVNVKYLQGIAAIKTDIDKMKLNASLNEWDLELDGGFYISAPVEMYSNEGVLPDSVIIPDNFTKTAINKGVFNFKNPGLAVDIGAVYNYSEDWSFSAAINDLGFIRWRGDVNSFTANGTYQFRGIEINGDNIDNLGTLAEDLIDTINTSLNLKHGHKSFSTGIGPRVYLAGQYHLNHSISGGLLSRSIFFKNDFRQEFCASVNLNLYHFLSTSLSYTVSTKGFNTLGLGLSLRGGPIQFYIAGDYFPYKFRSVKIEKTQSDGSVSTSDILSPDGFNNFNVIFGINFLIEPNGFRDEPMVEINDEF